MKKLRILLAILFIAPIFVSCSSDSSDPNLNTTAETISAKWNVAGTSEYQSFEFNKSGNYIVIKKGLTTFSSDDESNQVILFGTYQINNDVITLSNFGKLTVSDVTSNSISFKLALNTEPNNEIAITATKQAEMANSTKTDLLCRTWEIITVDDVSVVGTEDEEMTVLFSRAGTYFVNRPNDTEDAGGLAEWKWKNSSENIMLYSWDNWDTSEGANGEVTIIELTANKLVIFEDYGDDGSETFVLIPVQNTAYTSASINQANGINTRKGFIK